MYARRLRVPLTPRRFMFLLFQRHQHERHGCADQQHHESANCHHQRDRLAVQPLQPILLLRAHQCVCGYVGRHRAYSSAIFVDRAPDKPPELVAGSEITSPRSVPPISILLSWSRAITILITSSARELASIFFMMRTRCSLTVRIVIPKSLATSLLR